MNIKNSSLKLCEGCDEMDMILNTEDLCDECLKKKRLKNKDILSI